MTDREQPTSVLRERSRQRTRRAILEAVVELELAHGAMVDPRLLTYAKIAEVAGVSERTVYRFFPTKQDLDHAYLVEQPVTLDLRLDGAEGLSCYPDVIEAIMRRWSERLGLRRIESAEPDADDYPESMAARQQRDAGFVDDLMAMVPGSNDLPERQRLAVAAAVQSTCSVRTIAITAQRWGLTLDEAGRAHAFVLRTLLDTLATTGIAPWEEE